MVQGWVLRELRGNFLDSMVVIAIRRITGLFRRSVELLIGITQELVVSSRRLCQFIGVCRTQLGTDFQELLRFGLVLGNDSVVLRQLLEEGPADERARTGRRTPVAGSLPDQTC